MSAPEEPERELTHRFEYLTQAAPPPSIDRPNFSERLCFVIIVGMFGAVLLGVPMVFGDPGEWVGPPVPPAAARAMGVILAAVGSVFAGLWIWRLLGHPFASEEERPPSPWAPPHPGEERPRD